MLLERAELEVKPGSEDEFLGVMRRRGLPLLTAVPGVKWAKIGHGVESPQKFMFLVEWESLDAHKAFNQSEVSPEFRSLFAPYTLNGTMEHFRMHDADA
jgi:heme-degrading monooxygenase HmoA